MNSGEGLAGFGRKPLSFGERLYFEKLIEGSPEKESFQLISELLIDPLKKKYAGQSGYSKWAIHPTGDGKNGKNMITRFCSRDGIESGLLLDLAMSYVVETGDGAFYFGRNIMSSDNDKALLIISGIVPKIYVPVMERGLAFMSDKTYGPKRFTANDGGIGIEGDYNHKTAKDLGELILYIDNVIDKERRNFRTPEELRKKD